MEIKAFDGQAEIIYSNTFNIYENILRVKPIDDFEIIFTFLEDLSKKESSISLNGDNTNKKLTINLINFNNVLGIGTTRKLTILRTDDNKDIYFSIHAKSLNETTSFKQVSVTFYKSL